MCMVCGDPVQTQQEVITAVSVAQALASVPIFAIIVWQIKDLFRLIKAIIFDILKRLWRKKN